MRSGNKKHAHDYELPTGFKYMKLVVTKRRLKRLYLHVRNRLAIETYIQKDEYLCGKSTRTPRAMNRGLLDPNHQVEMKPFVLNHLNTIKPFYLF